MSLLQASDPRTELEAYIKAVQIAKVVSLTSTVDAGLH